MNGQWTPDGGFVTAWHPPDPFVVACHSAPRDFALYIDIVRAVDVATSRFAYVDLYVDVLLDHGRVSSKDEDLLSRLDPDEARVVIEVRDALLDAVRAARAPFHAGDPRWRVPDEVRDLRAGELLTL